MPKRTAKANAAATRRTAAASKPKKSPKAGHPTLLEAILAQLEDAKAEAVVTIDLDGKTAIADAMVAWGSNEFGQTTYPSRRRAE